MSADTTRHALELEIGELERALDEYRMIPPAKNPIVPLLEAARAKLAALEAAAGSRPALTVAALREMAAIVVATVAAVPGVTLPAAVARDLTATIDDALALAYHAGAGTRTRERKSA